MESTRLAWAVCVGSLVGCGGSSASPTEDAGSHEPVDASHDSARKEQSEASTVRGRDGGRDDAASEDSPVAPLLKVDIRCATAAVVGLEWAAVAGAAHYAVSRGGSALGTTATPGFSDTSVSASTTYSYSVTAYDKNDKTLITSGASATTAAALPDGDAPYCQSELIKSATWNWAAGFNQQNGSDLWPSTWGADGNVYLFFGDGGGFFGSDTNGRASFGIARITGGEPVINASTASNVYGGLNAAHPSTINGKAGSIFSVGNDFYALGGIYRSGEGGPAGSPNHYEIIASMGNAYSWQDTSWTFCAADAAGNVTQGTLCAAAFVHFGAGNAGAFDDNVYMLAVSATGWFSTVGVPGPASTYMMRAPASALTTESAYAYYAGLESDGGSNLVEHGHGSNSHLRRQEHATDGARRHRLQHKPQAIHRRCTRRQRVRSRSLRSASAVGPVEHHPLRQHRTERERWMG